eukprot:CAMPEP_0177756872 /NCGR_PEP_ID=MMETSP0491_2-20121128/3343_1 /TAXON_ID=63592 /ORGANISM="Tetraselmis chuii, Strain PLY429" /LENGTH=208 /DNA_ID=CAMNT_0019272489 /DNA_START=64 /DNA_END=690 /DNA_ORIENTATION=-
MSGCVRSACFTAPATRCPSRRPSRRGPAASVRAATSHHPTRHAVSPTATKSARKQGEHQRNEKHVAEDASIGLAQRLFAAGETDASLVLAAASLGACVLLAAMGEVQPALAVDAAGNPEMHPVAADLQQLAAQEDFWVNLGRYFKFFISLMTGTAYVITKPFVALLKRPTTAVLFVVGAVGFVFFIRFTIDGMLGLTDPVDYQFSPIN